MKKLTLHEGMLAVSEAR